MGETQQTAPAQIKLPSFSPCMPAPTNNSIAVKQQPDLAFNCIYFVRKDTRVWEITELQLRGMSRTHQLIPLARSPQPELLLTDTHQTCSHKPPRMEAPNLPSKALQQIGNLYCQSTLHRRRKIWISPTSSCRVPLSNGEGQRRGRQTSSRGIFIPHHPVTQDCSPTTSWGWTCTVRVTSIFREMNPTSTAQANPPPPCNTISSPVFEEPARVFRGFQKGSQGSYSRLVSQFLCNSKISTSSLHAGWMNEKCHRVECPRQPAGRE